MAFDLRAPVPIRFQRYINNTPVWEAGEEYFTGDIIRYFAIGETTNPNTLYLAIADNNIGLPTVPNALDSAFWNATSAGAVELKDIVLPADPLPEADALAFRVAIRANYETRVAANELAVRDLSINYVETDFSNLPTVATDYAVDATEAGLFRTAFGVTTDATTVNDDDIAISGVALPTGSVSTTTVSHIRVAGVLHPLGGTNVESAVFDYAFNEASAVLGSDEDDTPDDNFTAVLTVTTTAPHLITAIAAMIAAPVSGTDAAFAEQPVIAIAANGLSATLTQSIPTTTIRDFNWALTVSYSTGTVDQPDIGANETFMVTAAPVAGSGVAFSSTTLFTGTPAGAGSVIDATYTFTGGYGATTANMSITSVSNAVTGFDAATVVFTPVGATLGMDEANQPLFGAFELSVELDASADANSAWEFPAITVFNVDADVIGSAGAISGSVTITPAPARTDLFRGWTQMQYDGMGSDASAATAVNLDAQAEITDPAGYAALQQLMTNPNAMTGDISYAIAVPQALGLTIVEAIINVGGEQAVGVPSGTSTISVLGTPGETINTAYDLFLVKADGTFDAFDKDSIQTLIVR